MSGSRAITGAFRSMLQGERLHAPRAAGIVLTARIVENSF